MRRHGFWGYAWMGVVGSEAGSLTYWLLSGSTAQGAQSSGYPPTFYLHCCVLLGTCFTSLGLQVTLAQLTTEIHGPWKPHLFRVASLDSYLLKLLSGILDLGSHVTVGMAPVCSHPLSMPFTRASHNALGLGLWTCFDQRDENKCVRHEKCVHTGVASLNCYVNKPG
jgi:hypothetical protein